MNEYDIIDLLTRTAGRLPVGYSPIGDDVALIPATGAKLVLKADMLVGRTDVPPGMTWRQAGRKAVAMCVSDFAAKGVAPLVMMVSLGMPRRLADDDIRAIARGFRDAMDEWSLNLIGGDTNEADDVIVDCIVAGFGNRIVERKGARPGDLVVVTGEFGTTSAGLKILLANAHASARFRRRALHNVYKPSPNLKAGLALKGFLSSAMDSSDGLAICLHSLCEASDVGIRLERLPYTRPLEEFASDNHYTVEELTLYGGEEYEIVGTVPKGRIREAEAAAKAAGSQLMVVGRVTRASGVMMSDGRVVEKRGWIQLN